MFKKKDFVGFINRSIIAASLISVLSACGGGSESSSSANETLIAQPTPVVDYFIIDTFKIDGCGVETAYSNVDVVFHDEEGKQVANYKTDANGRIKIEIPEESQHVSIIGVEENATKILSYLNVSPIDHGKLFFTQTIDNQSCACHNRTLNMFELNINFEGYKLEIEPGYKVDLNRDSPSERTVRVCPVNNKHEMVLESSDGSRAWAALITLNEAAWPAQKLVSNDFSNEGILVQRSSEEYFLAHTLAWMDKQYKLTRSSYASGHYYNELHIFPSLSSENYIELHDVERVTLNDEPENVNFHSLNKVDDSGIASNKVSLPINSIMQYESTFIDYFNASLYRTELPFDFSAYENDVQLVSFYRNWTDVDSGKEIKWVVRDELVGTLPNLEISTDVFKTSIPLPETMYINVYFLGYGNEVAQSEVREMLGVNSRSEDRNPARVSSFGFGRAISK